MIFIFDVSVSNKNKDIAIVADTLEDAQASLSAWGILFCGGITYKLKEIVGLNDAGLRYYPDPRR